MLAVPEQFGSPIFAGIKDALALYGSGFILCGAALLSVALGLVPFTIGTVLVVIAVVPLPVLAWAYVRGGIAYAAGGLLIESVTLLAVAAARASGRQLPADRALPVMIGAIQLAFALAWLLRPDAFAPALLGSFYTRLDLAIPSFLTAGLAIVAFTVLNRPRLLVIAAALGIANLLAALVFSAIDRHSWTGIVQYAALAAFLVPTAVPGTLRLSVGAKVVGAIAIILAALLLLASAATTSVTLLRDTQVAVDQREAVIQDTDGLLAAVFDMQNSTRGFVITGDERFLAPYAAALTTARASLARLRQNAAGDPEAASIAKLSDEVQALDAILSRQAANRRSSFELARDQTITGDGRAALEAFRSDALALLGRVRADREAREDLLVHETLETRSLVVAGASLAAALALILALYLAVGIGLRTARLRRVAESTTQATDLERPIPAAPGGDDLDALARSLEAMRLRLREAFAATEVRAAETRALFESSSDAVLLGTPDGRVLDANPVALALFGRSLEELREGGRGIIIDPTDERLGPAFELYQRERRFAGHVRLRRRDGRTFEAEVRLLTYPGPLGDERVSFVGRDVTERERAEAEVRSARERAEGELSRINAVMASVNDGIYVVDPTGAFMSMNPAAERMLGWTSAELQGRNMHETVHHLRRDGSPYPAAACPLLGVLRTGQPEQVSSDWLVRRDGTFLPVRLSSGPVKSGDRIDGAVVSFSDVTAELASAAALEAAKETAEAANQAKSAFLANMSHELRTPLNAILGFSQLLEERLGVSLEDRQRGWLRNIQSAGTHLLELINDVLDLSKVEAGRYELRPEQITLADLLAPVLTTARQDAEARGLTFDASAVPATAVFLDPLRTRQILLNLVSNAAKFTERGGHVRLATAVSGMDLQLVVSDTGIGIPAADQDRVFGLFERLHEGRHAAAGTGLGLALTKRLVELQGGSISFTSEAGVGTTFNVSLPGAVRAETTGPRVLIVEDDPRDAALIAVMVAGVGMPVEIAGTGATALAAIRRNSPTAVVLDLRLPDMRGEAVLEALQADGATRRIPVIVVTVEDDEGRTRPLGAADHLTKPIDAVRLRRWLAQVADGQRGVG